MRAPLSLLNFSRLVSTIGDQFYVVALGVAVYHRTGSSLATVAVLGIRGLVHVLGMFVYRSAPLREQRRIAVAGDAVRVLLVLALIPALTHGLVFTYVLIGVIEAVQLYYGPARIVLVDASAEDRTRGHNTDQIVTTVALTLGLCLSGVVFEQWGFATAIAIDAGTFAVSAVALWIGTRGLRLDERPGTVAAPRTARQPSIHWILSRPTSPGRAAVLLAPMAYLPIDAFQGLLVVWALTALRGNATTYSVLETAMAIGLLLGSLFSARITGRGVNRPIGPEFIAMGVLYCITVAASSLPVAAGLLALSAVANMVFAMRQRLIVTRSFPDSADMGRAWQFYRSASNVVGAVGAIAVGAVADVTSVGATMLVSGVVLAAAGAALWRQTRPARAGATAPEQLADVGAPGRGDGVAAPEEQRTVV